MAATATQWNTANALAVMVETDIIEFAERNAVIFSLFTDINSAAIPGLTLGIRRWPDMSELHEDLTEPNPLSDISAAASTPTTAQITPAVTGMGIKITDLLDSAFDAGSIATALARQFRMVLVEEVDDDLAAAFTTLNGGTAVGGPTADLTLSDVVDGIVLLQTNQAPGPYFMVLHPRQVGDLGLNVMGFVNAESVVGASGAAAGTGTVATTDRMGGIGSSGLVGSVMGVPTWVSPRCPDIGTARSGVVASSDALTTVHKWMVNAELDRDPLAVSAVLAVTSAYAVGETADEFGIPIETGE